MDGRESLADRFEADRTHLRAVAYRMLGSLNDADDALQESWLRVSRADMGSVENVGGWLTTVVARVCLDMLRSRRSRREELAGAQPSEPRPDGHGPLDPEQEALLADSVGLALLVVLQKLAPAERVAFVLHDTFEIPFEEIARIVGRTPTAARQLASRARRRVRGTPAVSESDVGRQRTMVDAFLAASRGGDFEALLALLDPDVVLRTDHAAPPAFASQVYHGAPAVAKEFVTHRATLGRTALIDGATGVVVAPRGRLLLVLQLAFAGEKIAKIDVVFDRERLAKLDVALPEG